MRLMVVKVSKKENLKIIVHLVYALRDESKEGNEGPITKFKLLFLRLDVWREAVRDAHLVILHDTSLRRVKGHSN